MSSLLLSPILHNMEPFEILQFNELEKRGIGTNIKINTLTEEIESLLIRIDKCEENKDFDLATDLCFRLISWLPLTIRTFTKEYILRARKNEIKNGRFEIYGSKSQISYNPYPKYWGRFNKDEES